MHVAVQIDAYLSGHELPRLAVPFTFFFHPILQRALSHCKHGSFFVVKMQKHLKKSAHPALWKVCKVLCACLLFHKTTALYKTIVCTFVKRYTQLFKIAVLGGKGGSAGSIGGFYNFHQILVCGHELSSPA